jgi:hypothetical protein
MLRTLRVIMALTVALLTAALAAEADADTAFIGIGKCLPEREPNRPGQGGIRGDQTPRCFYIQCPRQVRLATCRPAG